MEIVVQHLLPNFILVSSMLYIWHYLLNKKIDFKNPKLYITLFLVMFISISNYIFVDKFVKIILITTIFIIFFKYLFDMELRYCIMTPIFYQILIMISEGIFVVSLALIFGDDANSIINNYFGQFISNVSISIITVIFIKFKFIRGLYKKVIKFTERIKAKQLLILSFTSMIIANTYAVLTYYSIEFHYLLIFNACITLFCAIIVIYSFKTKTNFNEVSDKYNIAIKSLRDYEDMITKNRIDNHENKNLLLSIRAMVLNGEKDIPKYIDSMIEEKYTDDEKLSMKINVIPAGGLRATIYSEILKIKKNNINYSLVIDNKIKTVDLIEMDTNTVIDVCKIIGVFMDNAIEEVKKMKKRNISIELYIEDNKFHIKISNSYKNKIEIDKISNDGYTTKGKNHGYGLSLVKKIIDKNNMLENYSMIDKSYFSQILVIKTNNVKIN